MAASQERWRVLHQQLEQHQLERGQALWLSWERWSAHEEQQPRNNRNRWLSDKRHLWHGSTGPGLQPWATSKRIERISSNDFLEFFRMIRKPCEVKGTSVDDSRRQYKTLIRRLLREAKADCPALTCPQFPEI